MSKKNKRQHQPGDAGNWNVNDVRAILHNPIYTGLGPFAQIVSADDWVAAQERFVQEDGAVAVLAQVRLAIKQSLGQVPEWMARPDWLDRAAQQCTEQGARQYFSGLLQALRDEFGNR